FETLGKVGTAGRDDIALLIPLLGDANFPEGRDLALSTLATAGPDARPALPGLVALLNDKSTAVRTRAIAIIAAIGMDARATAYTPLLELLRDPDVEVAK